MAGMWATEGGQEIRQGQHRGRGGKPAGSGVERVKQIVGRAAAGESGGEVQVGRACGKGGGGRQWQAKWEEAGSGQLCGLHGSRAGDPPGRGPTYEHCTGG